MTSASSSSNDSEREKSQNCGHSEELPRTLTRGKHAEAHAVRRVLTGVPVKKALTDVNPLRERLVPERLSTPCKR